MGIWIRTKDRRILVEILEVGLESTYKRTEIIGRNTNK